MKKFALVFFPENHTEAIQAFRESFDPKAELIAPHVTLVFPFPADGIDTDELILEIETKLVHHRAFQTHLHDTHLDPEDGLLHLLVQDGRQRIISLHNDLYSGMLDPYRRKDVEYIPHMTIGAFKTGHEIDQAKYTSALERLKQAPLNERFTFDNINLIAIEDARQPRTIVKRFDLI